MMVALQFTYNIDANKNSTAFTGYFDDDREDSLCTIIACIFFRSCLISFEKSIITKI